MMGIIAYFMYEILKHSISGRIMHFVVIGVVGIVSFIMYILLLIVLKCNEIKEIKQMFKKKEAGNE